MKVIFISVSGPSGSGKSSFSDLLINYYGQHASKIGLDNYYHDFSALSFEERTKINFDEPSSIDFDLFRTHLLALKAGKEVKSPGYDYSQHARTHHHEVIAPRDIIIVDGSLVLHHDDIAALFDFKIYIDTPEGQCVLRRVTRDMDERGRTISSIKDQYEQTVFEMTRRYVIPTKAKADYVLQDEGHHFITMDLTYLLDTISKKTGLSYYHRLSPNIINPTKKYSVSRADTGTLYVISGPSGVGKTTLIERLVSTDPDLKRIVPYTTREKRPGEIDGIDYHFVSHEKYQELIKRPVLEQVTMFNNHFFILLEHVMPFLNQGKSLVMDLLPDAVAEVKLHKVKMKTIFICPPGLQAVMQRLMKRDGSLSNRFAFSVNLLEGMKYVGYDYLVINDNLDEAFLDLQAIIKSSKLALPQQLDVNHQLFNQFKVYRILEEAKKYALELSGLDLSQCDLTTLPGLSNNSYRLDWNGHTYFL